MGFFEKLLDLPDEKFLSIIFGLFSLIIPGLSYQLATNPSILDETNYIKIIILSLFYSIHLFIACWLYMSLMSKRELKKRVFSHIWAASIVCLATSYLSYLIYLHSPKTIYFLLCYSILGLSYVFNQLIDILSIQKEELKERLELRKRKEGHYKFLTEFFALLMIGLLGIFWIISSKHKLIISIAIIISAIFSGIYFIRYMRYTKKTNLTYFKQ